MVRISGIAPGNAHQRSQSHRHGRELPEVWHQPGVRIGGESPAVHLLAEIDELLLGQSAFKEGTRVDPRCRVALHVDQVAAMGVRRGMPEMLKAGVVERGCRLEACDVAAKFRRRLVG